MAQTDEMTLQERRKYLRLMQDAYQRANRTERGRLLDTMVTASEFERKTLIRLMASDLKRRPRRRERGKTYQRGLGRLACTAARRDTGVAVGAECLSSRWNETGPLASY